MSDGDDTPTDEQESPPRSQSQRPTRPPGERLPFERIVPDLLKRGLEAGRGVGDTLFPRDLAANMVAQLAEAREGVVNVVGQEVGRFLRQADIASELRNVLAGLEVEANVKLKFRRSKVDVESEVETERVDKGRGKAKTSTTDAGDEDDDARGSK